MQINFDELKEIERAAHMRGVADAMAEVRQQLGSLLRPALETAVKQGVEAGVEAGKTLAREARKAQRTPRTSHARKLHLHAVS